MLPLRLTSFALAVPQAMSDAWSVRPVVFHEEMAQHELPPPKPTADPRCKFTQLLDPQYAAELASRGLLTASEQEQGDVIIAHLEKLALSISSVCVRACVRSCVRCVW